MNILKEIKTFFSSQKEKTIIPFGEKGKGNSFDSKDSEIKGVLLDIKGKNYFIIASAASKNSDGLRIFHETKARELNLIPNKNLDQSDIKKTGIKI